MSSTSELEPIGGPWIKLDFEQLDKLRLQQPEGPNSFLLLFATIFEMLIGFDRAAWTFFKISSIVLQLVVPAGIVLAIWGAYDAPENSFQEFLFVELFGGLATFLLAPFFFVARILYGRRFIVAAIVVAALLGWRAAVIQGVGQHLLLELSVGCALLTALDLVLKRLHRILRIRLAKP